jgi:hypothetical protein
VEEVSKGKAKRYRTKYEIIVCTYKGLGDNELGNTGCHIHNEGCGYSHRFITQGFYLAFILKKVANILFNIKMPYFRD